MKKIIVPVLVLVGLLYSCQKNNATDETEAIKKVLLAYFDGIKSKDVAQLNELTTEDFMLFENGKVWTNDSIAAVFKQQPTIQFNYSFDNFKIITDQTSGRMNYFNHGEITLNDTSHYKFDWIESATFRKVNDQWKLEFLHSTVKK